MRTRVTLPDSRIVIVLLAVSLLQSISASTIPDGSSSSLTIQERDAGDKLNLILYKRAGRGNGSGRSNSNGSAGGSRNSQTGQGSGQAGPSKPSGQQGRGAATSNEGASGVDGVRQQNRSDSPPGQRQQLHSPPRDTGSSNRQPAPVPAAHGHHPPILGPPAVPGPGLYPPIHAANPQPGGGPDILFQNHHPAPGQHYPPLHPQQARPASSGASSQTNQAKSDLSRRGAELEDDHDDGGYLNLQIRAPPKASGGGGDKGKGTKRSSPSNSGGGSGAARPAGSTSSDSKSGGSSRPLSPTTRQERPASKEGNKKQRPNPGGKGSSLPSPSAGGAQSGRNAGLTGHAGGRSGQAGGGTAVASSSHPGMVQSMSRLKAGPSHGGGASGSGAAAATRFPSSNPQAGQLNRLLSQSQGRGRGQGQAQAQAQGRGLGQGQAQAQGRGAGRGQAAAAHAVPPNERTPSPPRRPANPQPPGAPRRVPLLPYPGGGPPAHLMNALNALPQHPQQHQQQQNQQWGGAFAHIGGLPAGNMGIGMPMGPPFQGLPHAAAAQGGRVGAGAAQGGGRGGGAQGGRGGGGRGGRGGRGGGAGGHSDTDSHQSSSGAI